MQQTLKKALQCTNSNNVAQNYTGTCQVFLWEDLAMSGAEDRVLESSGVDWEMDSGLQCQRPVARHQGGRLRGEPECLCGRVRTAHWIMRRDSSSRLWRWRVRIPRWVRNRNRTPPSTGDPWRPARCIRMIPVELPQKLRIHDEAPGDPAALLRSIPLPVDKVLETTTIAAHPQ